MVNFPSSGHIVQPKVIAIVGASGYIGRHLVDKLCQLGNYRIKLLARSPQQRFDTVTPTRANLEVVEGDLKDAESLQGFFEHGCVVVNLVYLWDGGEAANLEVMSNLIAACKAAEISRLVHCSTAAVVGRAPDNLITEDTVCHPITEYGVTKLKLEQFALDVGRNYFDVVILRPTSVFGPAGDPLKKLTQDILTGSRLRNYLKSCLFGKRRMNLVAITNVIEAIVFSIQRNQNFNGDIFIVSDDDSSNNNFVFVEKFLMRALNVKDYVVPRISIPLEVLAFFLSVMGRNNINPRCVYSSDKLRAEGVDRAVTFENALEEYANWYCSEHTKSANRISS